MAETDLISRQAAIDALCSECQGNCIPCDSFPCGEVEAIQRVPSAQPDLDEWCTDCKEYDSERHCCPRWNRVIREAVEKVKGKIIHCRDCKHWDELLNLCKRSKRMALGVNGFCSKAERKEEHESD